MVKTIAIYLPQFHEVEDNSQWWGRGFTDWVAVRDAKPLYAGHRQPRVPLHQNYYNLLEYGTMKQQAELAKKYRVSGFCFYHYWFKGGRRILEKPAENLLKWTDIDMPFCFSWANQSWARTWSNIQNSNSWNSFGFEGNKKDGDGILLRQSYGGKKEWKEHFEYLLPFFRDSRYIRYDGKPVFLVYRPEYMYCLDNMMEYWKELAFQNGLEGICIITVRNNCNKWSQADYWLMQEFDYSFMPKNRVYQNGVWTIKYEDAWENILERAYQEADEKTFLGGFIDVDDTPRRGKRGVSIPDASPKVFERYYKKIAELALMKGRELLFVNAWNEWGEGAYMEPDEDYQYGYLAAIKNVMDDVGQLKKSQISLETKYIEVKLIDEEYETVARERFEKSNQYYALLSRWLTNIENGKKIDQVLMALQIKDVAVYGMGDFGKHLVKELEGSPIKVVFCFDKRAEFLHGERALPYESDHDSKIDAVIVTPVLEYKDIRLTLKKYFDVPIISLEELISECEIL